MGLPVGAIIAIIAVLGIGAVVAGKTMSAKANSASDARDDSVNNEHNISYGGRTRRNRQGKNKSRRR
jgi:hypothetical protein